MPIRRLPRLVNAERVKESLRPRRVAGLASLLPKAIGFSIRHRAKIFRDMPTNLVLGFAIAINLAIARSRKSGVSPNEPGRHSSDPLECASSVYCHNVRTA